MNKKVKEHREKLADTFIKSLEENQLDWKKEWKGPSMIPENGASNKKYKGINKFWLAMVAMNKGFHDPRWCTFKQIQDKGWKLNKGAKGEKVEYWMPFDRAAKKSITWDEFRKRKIAKDQSVVLSTKYYTVFNGQDIKGIPPVPLLKINDITPDEIIAKLSQNMGVEIMNDGNDRAFYRPGEDKIHLPKPEYFETDYAYNATALHELAHSTGAAHRLDRNIMNMFGSSDYAYEELIAEITSCFMSINLQAEQDDTRIDNHKAYVQSWIKAIKEKPDTLIKAIREAEKTASYMEYKAELISEKEYLVVQNSSMEVKEMDVVKDRKESSNDFSIEDMYEEDELEL
ncbi:ArdC family protein [Alkaliphilus sp. B6464]|uniref:ArdC family protein n=1 Tax=Alkaliphilus sp. B6464 TaxID=2731219 RepID=UPI001BA4B740|nr:zincin-like metallopeptidase domain-containing protein [Alkaliphilus sp. B6464]QUH20392.1 DUF1738 domain-containing protein [Alkaliphilus sp. B6464]